MKPAFELHYTLAKPAKTHRQKIYVKPQRRRKYRSTTTGRHCGGGPGVPELKGIFHGLSIRVPNPGRQLVGLYIPDREATHYRKVNDVLRRPPVTRSTRAF